MKSKNEDKEEKWGYVRGGETKGKKKEKKKNKRMDGKKMKR